MEEELKDNVCVARRVGGWIGHVGRIYVAITLLVGKEGAQGQGRECIPVAPCQVDWLDVEYV